MMTIQFFSFADFSFVIFHSLPLRTSRPGPPERRIGEKSTSKTNLHQSLSDGSDLFRPSESVNVVKWFIKFGSPDACASARASCFFHILIAQPMQSDDEIAFEHQEKHSRTRLSKSYTEIRPADKSALFFLTAFFLSFFSSFVEIGGFGRCRFHSWDAWIARGHRDCIESS